jgi:hypothetical protein
MQKLRIIDQLQALSDTILLDLGGLPSPNKALVIGNERTSPCSPRHHQAAEKDLTVARLRSFIAKPRLHENRAIAVLADLDGAKRERRVSEPRLAPKNDAGKIAERIKIEEQSVRPER